MARIELHPPHPGDRVLGATLLLFAVAMLALSYAVGYPLISTLALLLAPLGVWVGLPVGSIDVAPGRAGKTYLANGEKLILFCGGESVSVKLYSGPTLFWSGPSRSLDEAQRYAARLATELDTTVIQCVADTHDAACRLETAFRIERDLHASRQHLPDLAQIRRRAPRDHSPSIDRLTFPTADGAVTLDRQSVGMQDRFGLSTLLAVHLHAFPPAEESQPIAVLLYTLAGTEILCLERLPSTDDSPVRRERLGELLWLTEQIAARMQDDASSLPQVPDTLLQLRSTSTTD
jgi:hypothetical protein